MSAVFARRVGGRQSTESRARGRRPRLQIAAALVARSCALLLALASAPVTAQETITYTYDALGRLVQVNHGTAGPNANVSASYTYDKADNRTQVAVNTGPATLTLNPATLPSGMVGSPYSQTITATGGSGDTALP